MSWGYHLIIDGSKCMGHAIRNKDVIKSFTKALVKKIDMVPFGEPQIQHFGSGNKAGYTLVQLIETSNITAHFVEQTNDMYLDVFSCKKFDPKDVGFMVDRFFGPTHANSRFLIRQAGPVPLQLK
jgi:S-adenosylmethionine/arginine decarboxylase-like enzyme